MSTMNYNPPQLVSRLQTILDELVGNRAPTIEELGSLDQFHTGGLPATVRMLSKLNLDTESRVLDIGSGLGGPARYIAMK